MGQVPIGKSRVLLALTLGGALYNLRYFIALYFIALYCNVSNYPMVRLFLLTFITIASLYVIAGVLLFIFQRHIIYSPADHVHHLFDEMVFENDGQTIRTIVLNDDKEHAILYFGGNGESVAHTAMDFYDKFDGFSVYLMNYRGYGGSSGSPEEDGIYSDALYLYDSLSAQYQDVAIVGRSLGSAVATYVASERPVAKLVLVTPFDSVRSVAQARFPFYPMSFLLKDQFDSVGRAKNIKAKVLVLSADVDKVVGKAHTANLVENLINADLAHIVVFGAGHNAISERSEYYHSIDAFLR